MTTNTIPTTAADRLQDIPLDQLLGLLEAIAVTKHERTALDVPRYHQINGATFFLDRDGGMAIDEREDRRPLVKLTPDEVYGLLVFLRLPGVATLIEHLEAQRQRASWADFDASEEEEAAKFPPLSAETKDFMEQAQKVADREATRDLALATVRCDPELRGRLRREFLAEVEAMAEQMKQEREQAAEAR